MPASCFRIKIHLSLCFWYPYFRACATVVWEGWYKEAGLSRRWCCSGGSFSDLPLPCIKTLSKSFYLCFPVPFSSDFSAIFALGEVFVSHSVSCKDTNHKWVFWCWNSSIKNHQHYTEWKCHIPLVSLSLFCAPGARKEFPIDFNNEDQSLVITVQKQKCNMKKENFTFTFLNIHILLWPSFDLYVYTLTRFSPIKLLLHN